MRVGEMNGVFRNNVLTIYIFDRIKNELISYALCIEEHFNL